MSNEKKIRQRHEIPVEDTWAVEDLFVTDEAWEQELATIEADKNGSAFRLRFIHSFLMDRCAYSVRKRVRLVSEFCKRNRIDRKNRYSYNRLETG